jgi:hypothetical protein
VDKSYRCRNIVPYHLIEIKTFMVAYPRTWQKFWFILEQIVRNNFLNIITEENQKYLSSGLRNNQLNKEENHYSYDLSRVGVEVTPGM